MWFGSVYTKTLREFRAAIFGWGVGIGLLMYVVLAAINSVAGSPAARETLGSLAEQFKWLADPVAVTTPGGYATWKYGPTLLVMAIWALLVGSRMLRGEEERGSLDALLSLPRGRLRVALEKLAAMWTALLAMAVLVGLLTFAGGKSAQADFGFGDALLFGLNLALACGVFGSIALLLSQFTQTAGAAAGATGSVLFLAIIVDMIHRIYSGVEWISRLSPVYYYNLSKPIIPSYGTNGGALLVLLAISVILGSAGVLLFVSRDVGGTIALPRFLRLSERAVSPERALPANAWSLRSVYTRGLATVTAPTFWWTVCIAGFAAFMVAITKQTENQLEGLFKSSPQFASIISKVGGGDASFNATLLSFLFLYLPVLLMAFALTQASRWASDEENGRQELVLAMPQSRRTVVLARYGAVATATVLIAVITLAATALAASASGLKLDGGNLTAASLGLIPMGLLMAALGYLFSGWLRTAVDTGLMSFLLVAWVAITFVGDGLNWPGAVLHLSALYYYGTPILNGLPVGNVIGVLVVAAAALVIAAARFMRKDIAR
jgi:ABC-2 type transport system permease protein